jgi:predicted nucleotidyltransferase
MNLLRSLRGAKQWGRATVTHNLRALLKKLVANERGIVELYLFGSRRYGTGSLRSDCDIIVRADPHAHVRASNLRDFALERCPALDLFLCTDARAVSAANDSSVNAASFEDLVRKLDAVKLWSRAGRFENFAFPISGNWTFKTASQVDFMASVLPDGADEWLHNLAWRRKMEKVEDEGLPTDPFIGDTLPKAVAHISDIARRMIFPSNELGQRGGAKDGWTVNLSSEYDCQNLFFTVVKPWLPGLGREEVVISFDDQKKSADFNLFEGRLVIEMKYVDSPAKKAEVVKTLDGLSRFYARNANVGCLLFIILVKHGIELDDARWEADYSFGTMAPQVVTIVVRIP